MTKSDNEIFISIIVPFKNNLTVLKKTLPAIHDYLSKKDFRAQVILADTHSNDGSIDYAKKMANQFDYIEYSEPNDDKRRGKGQGIQDGFALAKGQFVMFMDADSSTPIYDLDKLLPYIDDYDIVLGSRYIKEPIPYQSEYFKALFRGTKSVFEVLIFGHSGNYTAKKKQGRIRQFISRGGNLAFTVLLNQSYVDQRCGFKLYRAPVAKLLAKLQRVFGWGFDTEYLAIAQKYHFRTIEVPVTYVDDADASHINPLKDTISSFKDIFTVQWNLIRGYYSPRHARRKLGKDVTEFILND